MCIYETKKAVVFSEITAAMVMGSPCEDVQPLDLLSTSIWHCPRVPGVVDRVIFSKILFILKIQHNFTVIIMSGLFSCRSSVYEPESAYAAE